MPVLCASTQAVHSCACAQRSIQADRLAQRAPGAGRAPWRSVHRRPGGTQPPPRSHRSTPGLCAPRCLCGVQVADPRLQAHLRGAHSCEHRQGVAGANARACVNFVVHRLIGCLAVLCLTVGCLATARCLAFGAPGLGRGDQSKCTSPTARCLACLPGCMGCVPTGTGKTALVQALINSADHWMPAGDEDNIDMELEASSKPAEGPIGLQHQHQHQHQHHPLAHSDTLSKSGHLHLGASSAWMHVCPCVCHVCACAHLGEGGSVRGCVGTSVGYRGCANEDVHVYVRRLACPGGVSHGHELVVESATAPARASSSHLCHCFGTSRASLAWYV